MNRILRIENLFLLYPIIIICFGLYFLFSGQEWDEAMEKSHQFPFFIGELLYAVCLWIALMGSAYLIHYFLRCIGAGNSLICVLHVLITIGILLYLVFGPNQAFDGLAQKEEPGVRPPFLPDNTGIKSWLAFIYWGVQAGFIVYGLIIIPHKVNSRLLRVENLLWLLPLSTLAFSLYRLFSGAIARYHATEQSWVMPYVVSHTASATLEWIALILPGYLMHQLLRYASRGSRLIRIMHVLLTIGILGYLAFFGVSRLYSDVPEWDMIVEPPYARGYTTFEYWLTVLFWLVQAAFYIYGLTVIHKWKRGLAKAS